ncbi:hypothetical protein M378DRAFT_84638 [Amanita muscaria Koide BX008]|uniref:APC amino acid permease n=1 Tax=Amanita muscaria (strain Koide BX008) TaxID=946122 RepID=A0A0C2WST7_AMAMK|nr:hypothetical protein M378DRAFT_84638 [Amanita muscaria Koide BX008]
MDTKESIIAKPDLSDNGVNVNADDDLLASFGYKPELKRNFTRFEIFGLGFSIIGILPSLASVLVYSIPYGGAVAMVWGWAICGLFLMCLALAMAELGSAVPTSGGLYFWTFMFSSPKWRHFLAWTVAYTNTIGQISSVASVDWGCAVQIMAAVSIAKPTFHPTTAQTFGVYCLVLLLHVWICTQSPALVARLQWGYVALNLLVAFAVIIAVPVATPPELRNSAAYVFGNFTNLTTWTNGFAFILSFMSPLWAVGGFDSQVHISEEARNANVAIPYGIILATFSGIMLGWGLNIALAFSMGSDTQNIMNNSIGQPFATILFNSFGQRGTLILWAFIVILQFTMGSSMLTAASRQIFAFSRDGGLPFSRYLYKVDHRVYAPVRCVWFVAAAALLLGLLSFAGTNAIGAVFSLVICSQNFSYAVPIIARFLGGQDLKRGPFHLGKLSQPIAAIAVTWLIFTMVVFLFPANSEPDAPNMNYAVVVMGGVLLLSTAYFYCPKYGGNYWFTGPVRTISPSAVDSDLRNDICSHPSNETHVGI